MSCQTVLYLQSTSGKYSIHDMHYDSTAIEVAQLLSFARYYAREVKLLHGIMRQRPGPAKMNLLAVRQLEP